MGRRKKRREMAAAIVEFRERKRKWMERERDGGGILIRRWEQKEKNVCWGGERKIKSNMVISYCTEGQVIACEGGVTDEQTKT